MVVGITGEVVESRFGYEAGSKKEDFSSCKQRIELDCTFLNPLKSARTKEVEK
jgi:hypothetical protein